MAETLKGMTSMPEEARKTAEPGEAERAAVWGLVEATRARGEDLTGRDGLLESITGQVLESALEEETTEHLGHEEHALAGAGDIRDGARPERVPADAAGEVEIEVPREWAGTFGPVVVKKRRRRLAVVDAVAISSYAEGSTTGEISARFAVVCGASICKDTVSRITDEGRGGDAGPVGAAAAGRVRGDLHRRRRCRGPRRAGRRPAVLRRDRGRPGRSARGARSVGRQGGGESAKSWTNVLADPAAAWR